MNSFVWVKELKVRVDSEATKFFFVGSGDFFLFIDDGFRDSSVDEVGFKNCELRLDDGFDFEEGSCGISFTVIIRILSS